MTRPSSLILSLALGLSGCLLLAAPASSSTIIYQTQGTVLPFGGVEGTPAVNFSGTPSQSQFSGTDPFSLGQFTVTAPSDGSTTTYTDAPFLIQLTGVVKDQAYPAINIVTAIDIFGRINGSVSSAGSTLVATVDAVQPGPVPSNPPGQYNYIQMLPFDPNALVIARDTPLTLGGSTTLMGSVQPVPEPATIAFFGSIVALIGWRHRGRMGR